MKEQVRKLAVLAVALVLSCAAPAAAGVLATGTGAMPGWFGAASLVSPFFSTSVEFAVFAAGDFDTVFGSGADPSGGTELVYAYQFFNSSYPLANVSVGLDANEPFTGSPLGNVGSLTGPDVAPSAAGLAGDFCSVRWDFLSPVIGAGQSSDILLYTCPALPEMGNVVIKNSYAMQLTLVDGVPNPTGIWVPEPATLSLLGLGVIYCLRRRRPSGSAS